MLALVVRTQFSAQVTLSLVLLRAKLAQLVTSAVTQPSHLRPVFQEPSKPALGRLIAIVVVVDTTLSSQKRNATDHQLATRLLLPASCQRCADPVRLAAKVTLVAQQSPTTSTLQLAPASSTTAPGACTADGKAVLRLSVHSTTNRLMPTTLLRLLTVSVLLVMLLNNSAMQVITVLTAR
jgi:hypothetical protein